MVTQRSPNDGASDDAQRGFTTIRPGRLERVQAQAPESKRGSIHAWFRERFRAPRRLKFTREGKFFIGITLGVGFAAINTANNLLYLMLGMLLALIVVSGVMSEWALSNLHVARKLPTRAQVGRAHVVEIEVFNRKGRVPSYAIEVEDLREGQPADKRCFFLKISPNSAQVAAYRRTPSKRGRDRHTGFRIATRFPFGLFEKSRELAAPGELVIYPAIDPVQLREQSVPNGRGDETILREGRGDEFASLRRFREGDEVRDVHWRTSARAGTLIVRQRAREVRPAARLTLDVHRSHSSGAEWEQLFERRIREAASLAVAHVKRGTAVALHLSSGSVVHADAQRGADTLLRTLALVHSEPLPSPTSTRRAP
jgi:uncharacterized protein (DUF58 family)